MDNKLLQHDLLYIGEHLTCTHYRAEVGVGFIYQELKRGQVFGHDQIQAHRLLIFLEGGCTIDYGRFVGRAFSKGQMVLLHRGSRYLGRVTEDLKLLVMSFEAPIGGCDKLVLQNYSTYRKEVRYDFRPTTIRYPLTEFFDLLVYCLRNGMSCAHLHEMKHKELFLYLRGFYTKEEITGLFYEIIGQEFDFRKFIYENHQKVNTLNELIELSNMSRTVFFRKFRKEFKETAYQWMLKQTCQRIAQYLTEPNVTVKDVMDKFGFASFSNFNRFCKHYYDCTPRQLCERSRKMPDCKVEKKTPAMIRTSKR